MIPQSSISPRPLPQIVTPDDAERGSPQSSPKKNAETTSPNRVRANFRKSRGSTGKGVSVLQGNRAQSVKGVTQKVRKTIDQALAQSQNLNEQGPEHEALMELIDLQASLSQMNPDETLNSSMRRETMGAIQRHAQTLGLAESGRRADRLEPPSPGVVALLDPRSIDKLAALLTAKNIDWKKVGKLTEELGASLATHLQHAKPSMRAQFLARTDSAIHQKLAMRLREASLPVQTGAPQKLDKSDKRRSLAFPHGSKLSRAKASAPPDEKTLDKAISRAVSDISLEAGRRLHNAVLKWADPTGVTEMNIPIEVEFRDIRTDKSSTYLYAKKLGSGGYATAYLYRDANNPDIALAGKVSTSLLSTVNKFDAKAQADLDREVRFHMRVMRGKPANVIDVAGAVQNPVGMSMVMLELMPKGEVGDLSVETLGNQDRLNQIKTQVSMSPEAFDASVASARRTLVSDVLDGINQVHHSGVSHNDMSGSNVFISADGVCKVADFGNARLHTQMKLNAFGEGFSDAVGPYPIKFIKRAEYRAAELTKIDAAIEQAAARADDGTLATLRAQRTSLLAYLDPTFDPKSVAPDATDEFFGIGDASPSPSSAPLSRYKGHSMPFKMDSRAPDYWNAAMVIYDVLAPKKNPLIYMTVDGAIKNTNLRTHAAMTEQLAAAKTDQARQAILFAGVSLAEVPQDMRDLITSMMSFDGSLPPYGQRMEAILQDPGFEKAPDIATQATMLHDGLMPDSLKKADVGSADTRAFIANVLCG